MSIGSSLQHLDLRGVPCPVNFIKCRLAMEKLSSNDSLEIDLDRGEPELMVIPGLREEGYDVQIVDEDSRWIKLMVTFSAR